MQKIPLLFMYQLQQKISQMINFIFHVLCSLKFFVLLRCISANIFTYPGLQFLEHFMNEHIFINSNL